MKADYSRILFNLDKNYTRVLQQQGRVTLDADWNEHVAIQAELDRERLVDLIGECGAPLASPGFQIIPTVNGSNLQILPGVIYVHGLRLELPQAVTYASQPFWPNPPALLPAPAEGEPARTDLVYLCVTERHITYLEDNAIREVALGGPDTTTRVQTMWQVGVRSGVTLTSCEDDASALLPPSLGGGRLTTAVTPSSGDEDPCITPAGSGYRGLENRLYRIEVHQGGTIGGAASVKWSRYNGAVAFPVVPNGINAVTRTIRLERLGWDQIRTLKRGDLIELISEADELNGVPGALIEIDNLAGAVDEAQRQITIRDLPAYQTALVAYQALNKVKVRLWEGEIKLADQLDTARRTNPIELEDGINVVLSVVAAADQLRSGDFWTFTARTFEGTIDQLTDAPPHGPHWYCCKLALIHWGSEALVSANAANFSPQMITGWEFVSGQNGWFFQVAGQAANTELLVLRLRELFATGSAPAALYAALGLTDATLTVRRRFATNNIAVAAGDSGNRFSVKRPADNTADLLPLLLAWFAELAGTLIEDCRNIFPPLTDLLNLYYVSGDGQEAMPDDFLAFPLAVRVNLGEHAVAGMPVAFELVDSAQGGRLFPEPAGGSTGDARIVVYTDAQGFALVRWQLGTNRAAPAQQVLAYLDSVGGQRKHLQVRFNANLSIAEQVSYVPPDGCSNLAGATTVAEALDKLCDIGVEDDPGFHIDELFWQIGDEAEKEARHDAEVELTDFVGGLRIHCDKPPDATTIKQASVYIRMQIPFGSPTNPTMFIDYIIPGDLSTNNENILWRPTPTASDFLLTALPNQLEVPTNLLARLTLKGSNIWMDGEPEIWLDGEVTSTPDGATAHNLMLPSGDGKRGGDFEAWFHVAIREAGQGRGDIFVVGVLHPATLIGSNTTRLTDNLTIAVINPSAINQRMDALDRGYDHPKVVSAANLTNYTPTNTPFDRPGAIERMINSNLNRGGIENFVWIQEEVQEAGQVIVDMWQATFRTAELQFRPEVLPADDLLNKLSDQISEENPVSVIICNGNLLARLEGNPLATRVVDANFARRL